MTYDISLTDGGASLKCLRRKPRVQFAELAMLVTWADQEMLFENVTPRYLYDSAGETAVPEMVYSADC